MITITNNYFQDLNAAIAAELFLKNAKPKKADLYAAIDAYNAASEVVADEPAVIEAPKKYEWVEVEVDRFDLPEGVNRCDSVPGFHEWFAASSQYSRVEGGIHEGYVAYQNQRVEVEPVAAAPAVEAELSADEEASLQAQLLAMDAAEDAAKAEAAAQAKIKQPRQPKELYAAPTGNRPVKPGSKVETEINALRNGATKEEILAALGWKAWSYGRSAALECGYGIRRDAEGKYWLVEPQAVAS